MGIYQNLYKTNNQNNVSFKLSSREMECLYHFVRGRSAKVISNLLGLSSNTVSHYLENVKLKMSAWHRSELIEKAIKHFPHLFIDGIT